MIPMHEFHSALAAVLMMAGLPNHPRADLAGVLLHFRTPDELVLVATGGDSIARAVFKAEHGQPAGSMFFMSTPDVLRVLDTFPGAADTDPLTISVWQNQAVLLAGMTHLTVDETLVAFPSYGGIFDEDVPECGRVTTLALIEAVNCCQAISPEPLFLSQKAGVVMLSADTKQYTSLLGFSVAVKAEP